jgi:hypothetical protein
VITGSDEEAGAGDGRLRAADADREHVIDLLKAAFVAGRLTKDELGARAGRALTAQTYAELAVLTDDIPAGPPAASPPRPSARPRSRPKRPRRVRNAAVGSVSSVTVGFLSFCYGASLDDHTTLLFLYLTLLSLITAAGIMGYGILTAVAARRPGAQLPPRTGQGQRGRGLEGQQRGSTGDNPPHPDTRNVQISARPAPNPA